MKSKYLVRWEAGMGMGSQEFANLTDAVEKAKEFNGDVYKLTLLYSSYPTDVSETLEAIRERAKQHPYPKERDEYPD